MCNTTSVTNGCGVDCCMSMGDGSGQHGKNHDQNHQHAQHTFNCFTHNLRFLLLDFVLPGFQWVLQKRKVDMFCHSERSIKDAELKNPLPFWVLRIPRCNATRNDIGACLPSFLPTAWLPGLPARAGGYRPGYCSACCQISSCIPHYGGTQNGIRVEGVALGKERSRFGDHLQVRSSALRGRRQLSAAALGCLLARYLRIVIAWGSCIFPHCRGDHRSSAITPSNHVADEQCSPLHSAVQNWRVVEDADPYGVILSMRSASKNPFSCGQVTDCHVAALLAMT